MFSIVMPLWNKQDRVTATIATAIAQTWRDFELIVVDDGSTDGGMAEVDRLRDPRILKLRQPHAGPGAARNAGIEAARHDWIAFLDADDIWLPDHLKELDRIRVRFPKAGLIGTTILRSDRKGRYCAPQAKERRIEWIDYFELEAADAWPVTTSSAAIPKRTYEELGGFGNAPCGQDIEYWARIALDRPVAISNRATAVYVLGTGGITDMVRSPCIGRELRHWSDVHPALVPLNEGRALATKNRGGVIDRYIDQQFQLCVRNAARLGDVKTMRALPRLYLRPPPPRDRLLLALARAPSPLALAAFRLGFRLKSLLRALKHGRERLSRSSARNAAPIPAPAPLSRSGNVAPKPLHHVTQEPPCEPGLYEAQEGGRARKWSKLR